MIRRLSPLGSDHPDHWLLIPQREHARLSSGLAAAWGSDAVATPFDEEKRIRGEFLLALFHHDDGWDAWWDDPGIDLEHGRPYSFTEMPPADAQRLWSASIEACREFGPLAGWMVAAHFSELQSKRDEDWEQWRPWIESIDRRRAGWFSEWLAESEVHTAGLAQRALWLLQAFDWMSLWLCCRCPLDSADADTEPLRVGGEGTAWPEICWAPIPDGGGAMVDPWPFASDALDLTVDALVVPADRSYSSGGELMASGEGRRLAWRLRPAE